MSIWKNFFIDLGSKIYVIQRRKEENLLNQTYKKTDLNWETDLTNETPKTTRGLLMTDEFRVKLESF